MKMLLRYVTVFALLCCAGLDAVKVKNPVKVKMLPQIKDTEGIVHDLYTLDKEEDSEIVLRSSKDDITTQETVSIQNEDGTKTEKTLLDETEDPLTQTTFGELFDEAQTDSIVIAAVITEVNNKFVAHYFDAYQLMEKFLHDINLALDDPAPFFTNTKYNLLWRAYKVPYMEWDEETDEATGETGFHVFLLGQGASFGEDTPVMVDPLNNQLIKMIEFFTVTRKQHDTIYSYEARHLGSSYVLAAMHFYLKLLQNVPPEERLAKALKISDFLIRNKNNAVNDHANFALADFLYSRDEYQKSAQFLEAFDLPRYWRQAGRIRLGFMRTAPKEEQLKGLDDFKKLLTWEQDNNKKEDFDKDSLELADLLYYRSQDFDDLKNILPYLQKLTESGTSTIKAQAYLWMTIIYYRMKDFDAAQKSLEKISNEKLNVFIVQKVEDLFFLALLKNEKSKSFEDDKVQRDVFYKEYLGHLGKAFEMTKKPPFEGNTDSFNFARIRILVWFEVGIVNINTAYNVSLALDVRKRALKQALDLFGELEKLLDTNLKQNEKHKDTHWLMFNKSPLTDFQRRYLERELTDVKKLIETATELQKKLNQEEPEQMVVESKSKKRERGDSDDESSKRKKEEPKEEAL